jgi:hypothetical protein
MVSFACWILYTSRHFLWNERIVNYSTWEYGSNHFRRRVAGRPEQERVQDQRQPGRVLGQPQEPGRAHPVEVDLGMWGKRRNQNPHYSVPDRLALVPERQLHCARV